MASRSKTDVIIPAARSDALDELADPGLATALSKEIARD